MALATPMLLAPVRLVGYQSRQFPGVLSRQLLNRDPVVMMHCPRRRLE